MNASSDFVTPSHFHRYLKLKPESIGQRLTEMGKFCLIKIIHLLGLEIRKMLVKDSYGSKNATLNSDP